MNMPRLLLGWSLLLAVSALNAAETSPAQPHWSLEALSKTPAVYPAEEPKAEGVRSLFYEGVPFQGKPTRVFAYVGLPKVQAGTRVPAMVLIHGGGGTAFDRWVRLWNDRGYAAIAMDLCGCVPIGKYGKWQRHAAGGPAGWGGFDQIDQPAQDQWTYHAVADAILGHSLLRSLPEVDTQRIGLTGISWGGYLTCILSGVDSRFQLAVPVYGCGFLGDNSTWLPVFEKMKPEQRARWLSWWDPSVYLGCAKVPMLWVTGTNDFAYPMDSLQKSYRLPTGPRTICLRVRMPHGHGKAGENPEEIRGFVDSLLSGGVPLARITSQGREGNVAWAAYESRSAIRRAELNYTVDSGKWRDRKWETLPAELDVAHHKASVRLPEGAKVYFLNLIDDRDVVVSTEHEEVKSR